MSCRRLLRRLAASVVFAVTCGAAAHAEQAPPPPAPVEPDPQLIEASNTLQHVHQSLNELQARAAQLRRQLAAATDEADRDELRVKLNQLEAQQRALRNTFQRVALTGIDLGAFEEREAQQEFNWQNELLSILRPLFYELRQLTEQPRALEQLRTERGLNGQRLQAAEQALARIQAIPADGMDDAAIARLQELERQWRDRHMQLVQERAVVQLQIDNLQRQDASIWQQVHDAFREFLVGRGLTIAAAILASLLVVGVLVGGANRWINYRTRQGKPLTSAKTRILLLAYRLISGTLAVMVFLTVLYAAGDAVLLALSLVVLVALLLSFRTYLPRYVGEAKLFLNAGQVREEERVIYRGIPWEITSIGFFAKLSNPELENGQLRIPLNELSTLISRPVPDAEPWFPTRVGDTVLLSDETFGVVERQTPELVQLRVRNSSVLYQTTDFLALRPRNLSRGSYVLAITFGIDYRHQAIATTEVPAVFTGELTRILGDSVLGPHIEALSVEFKEAGASSLDYLIAVTLNGAAADSFFKAGRLVQAACVDVCNARGWVIPFGQLTVHQGEGFSLLSTQREKPVERLVPA